MSLVRIAIFATLVIALASPATPSRADHYSDPPDSWTGYWAVPAFADIPNRGPEKAGGVIFWSHGVSGNRTQYHVHPPEIIRRLARAGWDVIKVQRNPLFERGWTTSGVKHVADLSERVDKALAQGYKKVIAAGQSYGGAISIEAASINANIFAVLAFSPGHGSDAAGTGGMRLYDNLTDMLTEAVSRMRPQRALVLVAGGDELHPREIRGARVRQALAPLGLPYVVLDEQMPIRGHGAAAYNQFDAWLGPCIVEFVDPAKTPVRGDYPCAAPSPTPRFLYPADLKIIPPDSDIPPEVASFSGTWIGPFGNQGREVSVVIERVMRSSINFVYATSSGPNQDLNMGFARRTAIAEDGAYVSRVARQTTMSLTRQPDSDEIKLAVTLADGRAPFVTILKRDTSR